MRFAHAPPRRLGPRSYPLYSSASVHSRGKTLVFPRLRQFLALQLSRPTNFCKETNFLLIQLLKNFKKLWMLLLFPFLRHSSNFQLPAELLRALHCPMTVPTPSCSVNPTPSPSGLGRGKSSSPSAVSRPTRKWMPHLAIRDSSAHQRASAQAVLPPPSGSRFQTRWFLHLLPRWRQTTVQELFFRLRTGFLHALDRQCHPGLHSSGTPAPLAVTVSESGPLTSPPAGRRQSAGVALWRPAMPLVDGQTSWPCTLATLYTVYSPCICISCYVLSNKLVLSYLLLVLLPQYPFLTFLFF
jgi:hypothetical protein